MSDFAHQPEAPALRGFNLDTLVLIGGVLSLSVAILATVFGGNAADQIIGEAPVAPAVISEG